MGNTCKALLVCILISITNVVSADGGISGEGNFLAGRANFKLYPEFRLEISEDGHLSGNPDLDAFMNDIGALKIEEMFPDCRTVIPGGTDISLIYTVYFAVSASPLEVASDLSKLIIVDYAEPWYVAYFDLEHNDPRRGSQYGLDLCEANEAHDISTGGRGVPIAIVDSGVDIVHEDLEANIWVNPGEDLDGDGVIEEDEINDRDDDRNGKVDDFWGWDFYSRDNDPGDSWGHGTHCAGIASAVTNNRRGIASVGYRCEIMAVRAGDEGIITHGYQGIQYTVEMGAKVISCSWGGADWSDVAQDILNNAYENDVLVLAAAGNDDEDAIHYPAGFDHVIAVAGTDDRDRKAWFSNYGEWVDISAPGDEILSTLPGDDYVSWSGTSMACPFAASVAILIRSTYRWMDVDEAIEVLLGGADDIYDVNDRYRGQLGVGRINAYHSLLLGQHPVIEIGNISIVNDPDHNQILDPGETAGLVVEVANNPYAADAEDIIISVTCTDTLIHMLSNSLQVDLIEPGTVYTNEDDPFQVEVSEDFVPHAVLFKVIVTDHQELILAEKEIEMVIGHPNILIVDDDGGADAQSWYEQSVQSINQGWLTWSVEENLAPEIEVLEDHDLVVWITGEADPPLDELDQWQLETAVYEGINILLVGGKIGNYESNRFILEENFGARHENSDIEATYVRGVRGQGPFQSDILMMFGGDGAAEYAGEASASMQAVNSADTVAVYSNSEDIFGAAGVYRINDRAESRLMYLGFALEGIGDDGTSQAEAMGLIYHWFTNELPDPGGVFGDSQISSNSFSLQPAYPNPFNSTVNLRYSVPFDSDLQLLIYDLGGSLISTIQSGRVQPGEHTVMWDAGMLPSGLYLARLSSSGFNLQQKLMLVK